MTDRRLPLDEIQSLGLPLSDCCCVEHQHTWYERTQEGQTWRECYHCAASDEVAW